MCFSQSLARLGIDRDDPTSCRAFQDAVDDALLHASGETAAEPAADDAAATVVHAVRVLNHYLDRWPIEVLFKESKQYLGLGDYQVLRYRGIERYLHLVLIAHLLLTHLGAAQGAQAEPNEAKPLDLPSVPHLQAVLRGKLLELLQALAQELVARDARAEYKRPPMLLALDDSLFLQPVQQGLGGGVGPFPAVRVQVL